MEGMSDARKLFRLFKSAVEYQKIQGFLKQKQQDHKVVLNIFTRIAYGIYWFFDNLQILAKIKFLENVDKQKAMKRAAFFWCIGLIFDITSTVISMYETTVEEA